MLTIAVVPVVGYYFKYDQQGKESPKSIPREESGDLAEYTRAIELNPKDAVAYNNRGGAKRVRGDLDGAIADLTKAIELDPKCAEAYYNRGLVEQAKGDIDGAAADFRRAAELNKP